MIAGWIEIQFWKFVKWLILHGYGYCDESDGQAFMTKGRCACCDATDVQKWIGEHIELIRWTHKQ